MSKSKKRFTLLGAGAVVLTASLALAQAVGRGILFPDWSQPSAGSYQSPHAELGKRSNQPWSTTTVAASIMGKTLPGRPISVTGEIIDLSCYLQVGKHGDKHRDCGQKCARAGQPLGLLLQDGTVYTLMDEEHDPRRDAQTNLRDQLIEHMAHVVKVNGTLSEVEGQRAIYVQGYTKTK